MVTRSPAFRNVRANSGITFRPDANTVLWLPGQKDPFSSQLTDESGNENHGVITGATWLKNDKGLSYNDFDGIANVILVTASPSIANIFDGGGRCLAWINPRSDGENDDARVFDKRVSGWALKVNNEADGFVKLDFQVDFDNTDGFWNTTAAVIPINTWSLVGVDYDSDAVGNNPTLLVNKNVYTIGDGLTEASGPVGTRVSDAAVNLRIGNNSGGNVTFDGGIWGSRLGTALLTTGRFQGHYQQERGLFGV